MVARPLAIATSCLVILLTSFHATDSYIHMEALASDGSGVLSPRDVPIGTYGTIRCSFDEKWMAGDDTVVIFLKTFDEAKQAHLNLAAGVMESNKATKKLEWKSVTDLSATNNYFLPDEQNFNCKQDSCSFSFLAVENIPSDYLCSIIVASTVVQRYNTSEFLVKPSKIVLEYLEKAKTVRCRAPLSKPTAILSLSSDQITIDSSALKHDPPISSVTNFTASRSELLWEGAPEDILTNQIKCEASHILLKEKLVTTKFRRRIKIKSNSLKSSEAGSRRTEGLSTLVLAVFAMAGVVVVLGVMAIAVSTLRRKKSKPITPKSSRRQEPK